VTNSKCNFAAGDSLVVVDAGGTKTAAWLVDLSRPEDERIVGRGRATAGNPLSVGFDEAARAIREAITLACGDAGQTAGCASRAILSIAGAANERLREQFISWALTARFAEKIAIVSDVLPVLAAGTPDCCGVALISGTGSVAFGRAADGRTNLRGGWGFLLGDEGSGYAIGRAALQHALYALEDGRKHSPLADKVLAGLGVDRVLELTRAIYSSPHPRVAIGAIAPYVTTLAEKNDVDAQCIIDTAADQLAKLAARTVQSIEPIASPVALAAAGGILLSSKRLQEQLQIALRRSGLECDLNLVREPLAGCVRLASPEFAGSLVTWQ
jgi:N-acetylglucosamine kinase-like BadF-type ATPase